MDLKFISEFGGLAHCVHPSSPSLFILTRRPDGLLISEFDLYTRAICRTYTPPAMQPDSDYTARSATRYERYVLAFLRHSSQLLLVYPFGYLAVFDYDSCALQCVMRTHGRHMYYPEAICFHEEVGTTRIFFTAEGLAPIYLIETGPNMASQAGLQPAKKIVKSSRTNVVQLAAHPKLPLVYGACGDGCVRVWDYQLLKETDMLCCSKSSVSSKGSAIGGSLSIDQWSAKLIYGNTYGLIAVWDVTTPSGHSREEGMSQRPFSIEAIRWVPCCMRSISRLLFACSYSTGTFTVFSYVFGEDKSKNRFAELCSLVQGEENVSIPLHVDRSGAIISHPDLPFIISVWPKYKGKDLLKASAFFLYQTLQQSMDLSKVSRMASLPVEAYNPERPLKAEPYVFYIHQDKIFSYSLSHCQGTVLVDLRKTLGKPIVHYYKFDSRPKGLVPPAKSYTFLVNCGFSTGEDATVVLHFDMVSGKLSDSPILQSPSADACFLGEENETNPPVMLLSQDRQHVNILGGEGDAPKESLELFGKARSLHSSPINGGRTIVYQSYGEHALKFSRNWAAEAGNKWNFAFLSDSNISLRLKYDEIASDLIWQSPDLCGITTNQRIIFTDNRLKLLYEYSLSSLDLVSSVTSGWWLGSAFLFTSSTHMFYTVPAHPFVPTAVLSFPEPRVVVGCLSDRVLTFSSGLAESPARDKASVSAKTWNVKQVPLMLSEPIIVGLLAGKEARKRTLASSLVARLYGGLISSRLIRSLNDEKLGDEAMALVSKPGNPQFTEKDKVNQALRLNDGRKCVELITGIKDISGASEDSVTEIMLRSHVDPTYGFEKRQLHSILRSSLSRGEYTTAFLCAELLNDQRTGYRLVCGFGGEEQARRFLKSLKPDERAVEEVMKTDIVCVLDATTAGCRLGQILHEDRSIRNWKMTGLRCEDFKIRTSDRKRLSALKLEDKKIRYVAEQLTEDGKSAARDVPTLRDSNMDEWLGYDLVVADSVAEKISDQPLKGETGAEIPKLASDITADNLSEADYLLLYYRVDDGPGSAQLTDVTENKLVANVVTTGDTDLEKVWGPELPLGAPLDYEDRWGVKASPNRSLKLCSGSYIQIEKSEKLAPLKFTFTLEMWIKLDRPQDDNMIMCSGKKDFELTLSSQKVAITDSGSTIDLPHKATIEANTWTHFAVVWHCSAEPPVQVLINGGVIAVSERKLAGAALSGEQDIDLCMFAGEVTEIRLWKVNLAEGIIRDNKKMPLAILASRQSVLQLTIKKSATIGMGAKKKLGALQPPKKSALQGPPKPSLPKPKTGGLAKPGAPKKTLEPPKKESKKVDMPFEANVPKPEPNHTHPEKKEEEKTHPGTIKESFQGRKSDSGSSGSAGIVHTVRKK